MSQCAIRSYIAERNLTQSDYDYSHMAGGSRLYSSTVDNIQIGSPDD